MVWKLLNECRNICKTIAAPNRMGFIGGIVGELSLEVHDISNLHPVPQSLIQMEIGVDDDVMRKKSTPLPDAPFQYTLKTALMPPVTSSEGRLF